MNRRFLINAMALTWLLTSATALAQKAEPSRAAHYGLKPGDTLEISVWREADMSREVRVRPDGGISFPLAGDLIVSGQSVEQVRAELNSRLRRFISEPEVAVAVKETGGNTFFVIGKVNKAGEFPMRGLVDVMQALSIAGGTATFAQLSDIKILRRNGDKQEAIPFRYAEVESGKRLDQNIVLKSGDVVVVP
ncbi:MAG: polysaccharide biosynthesis/export family protein [Panacagrimonas sp.]